MHYHSHVADTLGVTLSNDDGTRRRAAGPAVEPVLVLALECSRPQALSARWRLGGITAITLGRGSDRRFERTGSELAIRVPDRWM